MKPLALAVTVALFLIASATALLIFLDRADLASTTYASRAQAAAAGALGDGMWLPYGLPSGAINIRESHNVDTNEVWFAYETVDKSNDIPSRCRRSSVSEVEMFDSTSSEKIAEFSKHVKLLLHSPAGATFYICLGDSYNYYVAVDHGAGRVYGWSWGDKATALK